MNWTARINALVKSGWDLDSIAAEMGVTTNAIRELISGRTKSPRANAALKLMALEGKAAPKRKRAA